MSLSPLAQPCLIWHGADLCECLLHLLRAESIREPGPGCWTAVPAGRDACLLSAVMCTPGPGHSHFSLAHALTIGQNFQSPGLALTSLSTLLLQLTEVNFSERPQCFLKGWFPSTGACTIQQCESGRLLTPQVMCSTNVH